MSCAGIAAEANGGARPTANVEIVRDGFGEVGLERPRLEVHPELQIDAVESKANRAFVRGSEPPPERRAVVAVERTVRAGDPLEGREPQGEPVSP